MEECTILYVDLVKKKKEASLHFRDIFANVPKYLGPLTVKEEEEGGTISPTTVPLMSYVYKS